MKAVLDTKPNSGYNDDISSLYHFPRSRYSSVLENCVEDWVVFRRPRAAGEGIAYIGIGRLTALTPDPADRKHEYALIGNFTYFDNEVPWERPDGSYHERNLRQLSEAGERSQVGVSIRGKSARELKEEDFWAIINLGFNEANLPKVENPPSATTSDERERRIREIVIKKKVRLAAFRRRVVEAYGNRCALTGLSITSGEGHAEIQAAHILPVSKGGPDIPQNGLALTGTIHWLFDRHLISIDEEYRLIVNDRYVPPQVAALMRVGEPIAKPKSDDLAPSQKYLEPHRRQFLRLRRAD